MKKLLLGLLVVVLASGVVLAASDSFDITVSPVGNRGVIIGSGTVALPDMNPSSSETTDAIPCTSTGTIANIDYEISATVAGGSNLTGINDDAPVSTEICLQAIFNATVEAFTTDDVVTTGTQEVGNGGPGLLEGTDDGMDNMPLLAERNLFCKVTTPAAIDYTGQQTITVTLSAIAGD